MRAQTLPTNAGWRWIGAGFAIFRRNPPALAMLVISYWFTVLLLNILPIIGAVAASPIGIQTLYGGLKENTRTLVALGALYLGCTIAILGLSALVDGGELLSFMLSGKQAKPEAVEEGNFALPALVVALLMTPVMMAYWFAPVLAAWHKLTLGRALFFSFVACWLNWRPFLAFFYVSYRDIFGISEIV